MINEERIYIYPRELFFKTGTPYLTLGTENCYWIIVTHVQKWHAHSQTSPNLKLRY